MKGSTWLTPLTAGVSFGSIALGKVDGYVLVSLAVLLAAQVICQTIEDK